jgi:hypothetical protein
VALAARPGSVAFGALGVALVNLPEALSAARAADACSSTVSAPHHLGRSHVPTVASLRNFCTGP